MERPPAHLNVATALINAGVKVNAPLNAPSNKRYLGSKP